MKKLYIFSFLLILSTSNIFSQSGWYWQNPLPQGNDLNCVKFINNNTGIAVGRLGTIIRTTNGGLSWNVQSFSNSVSLNSISVVDSLRILVCGDSGRVMKSSNGGLNWLSIPSGTGLNLNKILFLNNLTGYIVGNGGVLLETTNQGNNWFLGQSGTTNNLYTIYFKNQFTGYLSGSGIYRITTNGGSVWSTYSLSTGVSFRDIVFLDSNTGFGAGNYQHFPSPNGIVYKTTNGGLNWSLSGSFSLPDCYSVVFKDMGTGCIASYYNIMQTTNSGASWVQSYPTLGALVSLEKANNSTYACGNGGSILKSTNFGLNWENQTNPFTGNANSDVFFINEMSGYICGNSSSDSTILRTTNGGANWTELAAPKRILFSLFFTSYSTGYCVGGSNIVYKTTNAGINWINYQTSSVNGFRVVYFVNTNTGFASGYGSNIYKTTNGGLNWEFKYSGEAGTIYSFSFPSLNIGYAVEARYGILKTTDNGNTWSYTPYISNFININKVCFINNTTGFVFGLYMTSSSRILKTTNSGMNWQPVLQVVADTPIQDFDVSSSGIAYVVCEYGKIYKSLDTGNHWGQQISITDNKLNRVRVMNDSIAYIVGDYKTIIKTSNGGGGIIGIKPFNSQIPHSFSLHQNYPNPFNPVTKIQFEIPLLRGVSGGRGVFTKILIYDLLGREITTLVDEQLKPGTYEVEWDGTGFASGVYFYSLITSDYIETKRMVLVK